MGVGSQRMRWRNMEEEYRRGREKGLMFFRVENLVQYKGWTYTHIHKFQNCMVQNISKPIVNIEIERDIKKKTNKMQDN